MQYVWVPSTAITSSAPLAAAVTCGNKPEMSASTNLTEVLRVENQRAVLARCGGESATLSKSDSVQSAVVHPAS